MRMRTPGSSSRRASPGFETGEQEILTGGEIEVRVLPRDHFARIEQPPRIRLALERELDRVSLFHAALLEGVAVGIENHCAHRFMLRHDFIEPLFGRETHQWQAGERNSTVEPDELQVSPDLGPVTIMDPLDQPGPSVVAIPDLQIGDARID